MKPVKTWRERAFYVVQHKDEPIADDLYEIAWQLGHIPWRVIAISTLLGVALGVAVAAFMHFQEVKNLKKSLFSAQAELTVESVKCSKR